MPITMTRSEYQAKYGTPPPTSIVPTSAPIKMTRAEYEAKYGQKPSTQPQTPITQKVPEHNFWQTLKSDVGKRTEAVENIVDISTVPGLKQQTVGEGVLQTAGQAAGGVLDLAGNVASSAMPNFLKQGLAKTASGVGKLLPDFVKEGLKETGKGLTKLPGAGLLTPRVQRNVEAVGNLAGALTLPAAVQDTAKVFKTGVDIAKPEYAKAIAPATEKVDAFVAARKAKALARDEKLVGDIIQSKHLKDRLRAERALRDIDATDIKTELDLKNALDDKIENLAVTKSKALATDTQLRTMAEMGPHNYVDDAMTQLDEFYAKTNNPAKRSAITQLRAKAETQGLTVGEMDDLAILHGKEITAFNTSGEAASGLSKQAAENTRKGVKSTARKFFDDPIYRETDAAISDTMRTRDLIQKRVQAVTELSQKIQPRGWGKEIGYQVMKVVNMFTGNTLKGAVEFLIPRGQGYKLINALDMEKMLQGQIKSLQRILNNNLPKSELMSELNSIIESGKRTSLGGIKVLDIPAKEGALNLTITKPKTGWPQKPGISIPGLKPKTALDGFAGGVKPKTIPSPEGTINVTIKKPQGGWWQGKNRPGIKPVIEEEVFPKGATPKKLGILPKAQNTSKLEPLAQEARKYKSAEEFVKAQTKSNSWSEAQKTNPDLWNKGILRKDIEPYGAKGVIPKEVHSAQGKWQNYGEFDEISADKVYKRIDSGSFKGEYEDKFGNAIHDNNGNVLQDIYDDATGEWIKPMVSNKELRNQLLDTFTTKEGKQYLNEVINALPKNPDGTITAYRIGKIGGGEVQSYTLSEGMAKTFSNQGTSVLPVGTPGLPAKGYKDFGALPANMVKINPKGIKAWSPYDAEILVEPKYVQTKSQLTDIYNQAKKINPFLKKTDG